MKLFCIIDKKASSIVATFSSVSDESAIRSFMDLVTTPQDNLYSLHFDDFAVYSVGSLSFEAGLLSLDGSFISIFDGSSLDKLVVQSEREKRLKSLLELNKIAEGGSSDE